MNESVSTVWSDQFPYLSTDSPPAVLDPYIIRVTIFPPRRFRSSLLEQGSVPSDHDRQQSIILLNLWPLKFVNDTHMGVMTPPTTIISNNMDNLL
ncbi:hypothetical protein J6590_007412 [Homalodisca vitripennis]|nr:hypothetical protein J6590_007412 [Homalodisca vitripennis]